MTEKNTGKFLLQLEESFADKNPVLLQTAKAYHELDQIYYDLGFIDADDSVASKISWWPVITMIGSPTSGKAEFINQYFKTGVLQTGSAVSSNKISVLFYGDSDQVVTLPGAAIDRDSRFPFYHFSDRLDLIEEGEGRQINTYLELKTCNSAALKGKLFISAPGFPTDPYDRITPFFMDYIVQKSDLVLVFFDANDSDFEPIKSPLQKFITSVNNDQNTEKFIFVINQSSETGLVDLAEWKQKLADLGLASGRFFSLQKNTESKIKPSKENRLFARVTDFGHREQFDNTSFKAIEKVLEGVTIDSAYRIVGSLENSIHELDEVAIHEVREAIKTWKNRSHFTITLLLSFLAIMLVMAEIETGFLAVFIDPVIGPASLAILIAILIPVHIYSSKQHAKWVFRELERKQKELGLIENLAAVFEQNITLWRILLPVKEPAGWNKEIKFRLTRLLDRSKELVQTLNDSFSSIGAKSLF